MPAISMLYRRAYKINDKISIIIPTVGEIIDNEEEYYSLVSMVTSMPIDLQVQLDDMGIDYTKVTEWDVFLISFNVMKTPDTKLLFGELDLSLFELMKNEQNQEIVLYDKQDDIVIDRAIHDQMATVLRKIHHLQKNNRKPANEEAKRFMLERERKKQKRKKKAESTSGLENLIVALVNTEQFKYDFRSVLDISIYQFNESLKQIMKKINYDNLMRGVYAGTIDSKGMNPEELSWLST